MEKELKEKVERLEKKLGKKVEIISRNNEGKYIRVQVKVEGENKIRNWFWNLTGFRKGGIYYYKWIWVVGENKYL